MILQVFCRCCNWNFQSDVWAGSLETSIWENLWNLNYCEMYQQMAAVCKRVLYLDVVACYPCVIVSPCNLQSSEAFDEHVNQLSVESEHETSNRSESVCGQTGFTGCSDRTASLTLKRAVCLSLCLPLCVSPSDLLILPAGNCCLGLKVENVNVQSE